MNSEKSTYRHWWFLCQHLINCDMIRMFTEPHPCVGDMFKIIYQNPQESNVSYLHESSHFCHLWHAIIFAPEPWQWGFTSAAYLFIKHSLVWPSHLSTSQWKTAGNLSLFCFHSKINWTQFLFLCSLWALNNMKIIKWFILMILIIHISWMSFKWLISNIINTCQNWLSLCCLCARKGITEDFFSQGV